MEYFKVMYDSRVVIYERKMFIRLATDWIIKPKITLYILYVNLKICDWLQKFEQLSLEQT